ncbi:nucleotide exchange factor SIL1 domain-containing protein [Hirsutella rhossiliensis]
MDAKCPDAGVSTIGHALYSSLAPYNNADAAGDAKQSASRVKAKVLVINGLLKNGTIRGEFLSRGGMDHLLEVLVSEGRDWAAAQRKAGQLVLDNFLDGDMGATLGLWPRVPRLSDEQCRSEALKTAEGCWDYHVARITKGNRYEKGHWSTELNAKLVVARGGDPTAQADGSQRAEL